MPGSTVNAMPDFQHAPFTADLVLADIVHIHAQPVAGAVHVETRL